MILLAHALKYSRVIAMIFSYGRMLLAGLLLLLSSYLQAALLEGDNVLIERGPGTPTTAQPVSLLVTTPPCHFSMHGAVIEVDRRSLSVEISIDSYAHGFLCTPAESREVLVEGLTEVGTYTFYFYHPDSNTEYEDFEPDTYVGSFEVPVAAADTELTHPETPAEGSIQSGIGLVRGWACNAQSVAVQFDNQELIQVAYGTSRPDTKAVCGDENNGYGMVLAWGLLGHGNHTMKTFIDDVEVSEVTFTVAGLKDPFIRGLSGRYELDDFPVSGESVIVEWSQADQNFIIVEHRP